MTDIIDSGDVAESNGEDERTSDLLDSLPRANDHQHSRREIVT